MKNELHTKVFFRISKLNHPSFFFGFFFLFVFLFIGQSFLKSHNKIPFDNNPQNQIKINKPSVVFIGNSMLETRINSDQFAKTTGEKTSFLYYPGGTSAFWYLILKNIVIASEVRPKIVFIFFRDPFLTYPGHRASGIYQKKIDKLSLAEEPVFDKLISGDFELNEVFLQPSLLSKQVRGFLGVTSIQERHEKDIKRTASTLAWLACYPVLTDKMVKNPHNIISEAQRVLDSYRLRADLQVDTDISANLKPYYNFDVAVEKSFLPPMLEMARKKAIQLVFVRVKKRDSFKKEFNQNDPIVGYLEKLALYLKNKNAFLLDFTYENRVQEAWYGDGDHISEEYRSKYTQLFYEKSQTFLSQ